MKYLYLSKTGNKIYIVLSKKVNVVLFNFYMHNIQKQFFYNSDFTVKI